MKTTLIAIAAAVTMIFGSVAPSFAQKKTGIISIYVNKQLGMDDFSDAPGLAQMVIALAESEDFDLTRVMAQVHSKAVNDYKDSFEGYELMSEEEVLNSEGYDESLLDGVTFKKTAYTLTPEGYVAIGGGNKKAVKKSFTVVDGMEACMIVSVDYDLVKTGVQVMGFGNAKVQARVVVKILDANGKKLFKAAKTAKSDGKMKFAFGGVMDTKEIIPLVEDATNKAFELLDAVILKKQSK